MDTAFRWLVRLMWLILSLIGLGFLFVPDKLASKFAIQPVSAGGFATLRGDLGGLFLGIAVFCFLGAREAGSRWLRVPTLFLAAIILGRFFNLLFDGVVGPGIGPLLFEIVLVLVLIGAQRVLGREEGR
jgi:hypothetical protein